MRLRLYLTALLPLVAAPLLVRADATFQLRAIDDEGEGFSDPTAVSPVGGNSGTTLGEQRRIAVSHALDLWGAVLDSEVPIVVQANFAELGCADDGSAVLASAAPTAAVDRVSGSWADPDLVYPSALGDRLLGRDALAGEADVDANFNSSIDMPSCKAGVRWYYGLDGKGTGVDLVQTTLHELAHGLGMTLLVDSETGSFLLNKPDPLAARIYDHTGDQRFTAMSDGQRKAALSHSYQVVFDGPRTVAAARDTLSASSPQLVVAPEVPAFSGLAADTNFAPAPDTTGVTAPFAVASPVDGCSTITNASGHIVLVRPVCFPDQTAIAAAASGAVGLIVGLSEHWQSPPSPLDLSTSERSPIPVFVVSEGDANALTDAAARGPLTVTMRAHPTRHAGTDDDGRPLLNATAPVTTSMLTHWDMSARPNLLMEPFVRPMTDVHALDLTLPALEDLGWSDPCGNGLVDGGVTCDDAPLGGESGACGPDCSLEGCADACTGGTMNAAPMVDAGEPACASDGCSTNGEDSGCGCRLAGHAPRANAAIPILGLFGALVLRVRRRSADRREAVRGERCPSP